MSRTFVTIDIDETLLDACQLLLVSGLRYLVVTDDAAIRGLLVDRAVLARGPLSAERLAGLTVGDALPRGPALTIRSSEPVDRAAASLAAAGADAALVFDGERLVGVLTPPDLIAWLVGSCADRAIDVTDRVARV